MHGALRLAAASLLTPFLLATAPTASLLWRPMEEVPRPAEPLALARSGEGYVALGDRRGVWRFRPGEPARLVLRRGPVHDLAFQGDGTLLAATGRGLWRVAPGGDAERLALGTGERSQQVTRVARGAGLLAAGTEAGTWVSRDGRRWLRVEGAPGRGVVHALALVRAAAGVELWVSVEGRLRRALLDPATAAAVRGASLPALPGGPPARDAVDVFVGRGGELVVLAARDAAVRSDGRWRRHRLGLPAGARATRAARALDRLWLATDRGLLVAPDWEGPWQRADPPAGERAVAALASGPARVFAVGPRGGLVGRVPSAAPALAAGAAGIASDELRARFAGEPTVGAVHVAVLRHLELGGAHVRALWRGVRRRGWLPRVTLQGAYGDLRSLRVDQDQVVFSSGAQHDLLDTQSDHDRDFEVALLLSWDLGDVVYHPEAIDVSKEAREVIELRDEVLDEVTQLYFARRVALLDLLAASDPAEGARLRLRADELAAGLDAWTGGWFGRRVPPLGGPPKTSPPDPEETKP